MKGTAVSRTPVYGPATLARRMRRRCLSVATAFGCALVCGGRRESARPLCFLWLFFAPLPSRSLHCRRSLASPSRRSSTGCTDVSGVPVFCKHCYPQKEGQSPAGPFRTTSGSSVAFHHLCRRACARTFVCVCMCAAQRVTLHQSPSTPFVTAAAATPCVHVCAPVLPPSGLRVSTLILNALTPFSHASLDCLLLSS